MPAPVRKAAAPADVAPAAVVYVELISKDTESVTDSRGLMFVFWLQENSMHTVHQCTLAIR